MGNHVHIQRGGGSKPSRLSLTTKMSTVAANVVCQGQEVPEVWETGTLVAMLDKVETSLLTLIHYQYIDHLRDWTLRRFVKLRKTFDNNVEVCNSRSNLPSGV